MGFDHATHLRLVRESLEWLYPFGAEPINVRDLKTAVLTLVVEVTSNRPIPSRS